MREASVRYDMREQAPPLERPSLLAWLRKLRKA
jgi:hypothetical protein